MSESGQLQPFQFEGLEVRFVGTIEVPEWVARDVVLVLYGEGARNNVTNYLSKVPVEWKGIKQINTPGGRQELTTLYEPGLYALIARSESPLAVPFQKWVYEDVLPSIRKTGSYSLGSVNAGNTDLQTLKLSNEIDELRINNIRTGLDLMYELGGVDERTQLAVKDMVRDIILKGRLKTESQPGSVRQEIPISDRARDLGYRPNSGQLKQMGRVAAKLYRLANDNADPPKREQFVDGTTRMVFCYNEDHLDILDNAIALVMEKPKQLPPASDLGDSV
ncbi:Bro-N domain-containing protein [Leptolyngbyaceae cyanobacterium UHCC 1019]